MKDEMIGFAALSNTMNDYHNRVREMYRVMDRINESDSNVPARLTAVCEREAVGDFNKSMRQLTRDLVEVECALALLEEQVSIAEAVYIET